MADACPDSLEVVILAASTMIAMVSVKGGHELGHLLTALNEGWPGVRLRLPLAVIEFRDGRWSIQRSRALGLRTVLGAPNATDEEELGRQRRRIALAGPAATLAQVVVLGLAAQFGSVSLSVLIYPLIGFSAFFIFLELVPRQRAHVMNDGYFILRSNRSSSDRKSILAMLALSDLAETDTRPGKWPTALAAEAERILWNPEHRNLAGFDPGIYAGYLLYFHYADQQRWNEAERAIARASALQPVEARWNDPRRALFVDLTFAAHLALFENDLRGAHTLLANSPPKTLLRLSPRFHAMQAVIALSSGEGKQAVAHLQKAIELGTRVARFSYIDAVEPEWWKSFLRSGMDSIRGSHLYSVGIVSALFRSLGSMIGLGVSVLVMFLTFLLAIDHSDTGEMVVIAGWTFLACAIIVGGSAAWIGRQTNRTWAVLCLVFWGVAVPVYVFRQSRGLLNPVTGLPAQKFPLSFPVAVMFVASIYLLWFSISTSEPALSLIAF
jgi:hypothetical protein